MRIILRHILILALCGCGAKAVNTVGDNSSSSLPPLPQPSPDPLPTPTPIAKKAINPGHYIAPADQVGDITKDTTNTATPTTTIISYAQQPGVNGLQLRYYWRDLESAEGVYNFDAIKRDLDSLQKLKPAKKLIILVIDKSFTSKVDPTPLYMRPNYIVDIISPIDGSTAHMVKRWDPYVRDRFIALFDAMAKQIDAHPALEGVAMQETASGQMSEAQVGYDADAYANNLQDIITSGQSSFKQSKFFWYQNMLSTYQKTSSTLPKRSAIQILEDVADYVMKFAYPTGNYKPAIGGPDVLPDGKSDQNIKFPVYEYLMKNYLKADRFCSMQKNSYIHTHLTASSTWKIGDTWSMSDLFDFATSSGVFSNPNFYGGGYGCDYVFWNIKENGGGNTTTNDALPVISAHQNF